MAQEPHTVVQCDFDDTVTVGDVSYLLLDAFAGGDWRQVLEEYRERRISVGTFNARVFAMVRVDEQTMLDYLDGRVRIRPGFGDLVRLCRERGFRLVIVSNGLRFYIDRILTDLGVGDIDVHAAQTRFLPDGLEVAYLTPAGDCLVVAQSAARAVHDYYVTSALEAGHRVMYIGDGRSDFIPARRCHRIFATSSLLSLCRQSQVDCVPFSDFRDIVGDLESL